MTEAARKWMEKNKPKPSRSKMAPYSNDLLVFEEQGYTLVQMQDFLLSCNVVAGLDEIYRFLKRQKNQKKGKKDIATATAKTNSNVTIFPEAAEKPNKYANLTPEEKQALVAEKLKRRSNQ